MMVLLIANLTLIIVEWLYVRDVLREWLAANLPTLEQWYGTHIHEHFYTIDLAFIAVFLVEFIVRWGLSIARREHYRWWWYPIIRWYDVLGCVPLSAMRFLRVLRVVAMVVRLQQMGVIDLRRSFVYQRGLKYYRILEEEITDRVVLRVLSGMQAEIQSGAPVLDRIVHETVLPRRPALVAWLSERIRQAAEDTYQERKTELRTYIATLVDEAVDQNKELRRLALVPVVGKPAAGAIESAIGDITFNVVDGLVRNFSAPDGHEAIDELTEVILEILLHNTENGLLNQAAADIAVESLEHIKAQVAVKQWRIRHDVLPVPGATTSGIE